MEKAYLITENTDLSMDFSQYDRIYFGDQYCEHNMFFFLEDTKFLSLLKSINKPLTLTTPIISENGRIKLYNILDINSFGDTFEIVVNDYGMFHGIKVKYPDIQLVWGNFLSGQNKDPYLKDFKDKDAHKNLSIDSDFYKNLFSSKGIENIELYNVFQETDINQDFEVNMYYPYVVYSINRYCISNLIANKIDYMTVVEDCDGCTGKVRDDLDLELKISQENIKNYFRGNKQFYKNKSLPNKPNIKRIIYNDDLIKDDR